MASTKGSQGPGGPGGEQRSQPQLVTEGEQGDKPDTAAQKLLPPQRPQMVGPLTWTFFFHFSRWHMLSQF